MAVSKKKSVKVVLEKIKNVGDLIDALSTLPRSAKLEPMGDPNVALCYDESLKRAYLDNIDWFYENELLDD